MSKGQITIPKDVCEVAGVSNGNRVTFFVDGNNVIVVNYAVYAMQTLQAQMQGEEEKACLNIEKDVMYH